MPAAKTRRQTKAVASEQTINVSMPDDVDVEVLSELLPDISLESPSQESILALYRLVMEQANEIDTKQQALDEAYAEAEKKDVELDQALQDKETASKDLEMQIQSLQDEVKDLKHERDRLLTSQAELQNQVTKLSSTQSASSSEVGDLKHRLQDVEREKRDLMGVVSRLKEDESSRDEEIQTLRKNLKEARQEHQDLENQLRELRSADTSSKFKLDSLSQQLALAQAEVERLNSELMSKAEDFTKYRRTKQAELVTLQANFDSISQSHDSTSASLKALQSSHTSQTHQLTQALTKVHDLTAQLAEQEGIFNNEANGLRRLVSVLESREKQAKEIVEGIEKEWAEVADKMDREDTALKADLEKERKGRQEAEKKLDQMQTVLEKMNTGELPPLPGRLSGIPSRMADESLDGMMGLSPTVAIASKVQKSGRTFTEVYADYVRLQEDYDAKCQEYDHMDRTLTMVLRQIEERAPVLSQQRTEYERLQSEATQLASQLAQALADRDTQKDLADDNAQKYTKLERQNNLLERQLDDLGRQVQNLLREIGRRDDPTLPADEDLDRIESVVVSDDVDSMITNNLVLFKSISGLQEQNKKLLRIVRELGRKMETEEREYREAMEREQGEAVREAHEAIQDLAMQLERQKKSSDGIIQTYVKERDALKGMIARLEAGGASSRSIGFTGRPTADSEISRDMADIQNQFDAYRAEMGVDSVRLREDLAATQKEVARLQADLAKEKARSDYFDERNRIHQGEYDLRARELDEASKRNQQLYDQWTRADIECARVVEDFHVATGRIEQLRNECANLRAEKKIWESVQGRLVDENKTLTMERAHLSDMMSNIQKMNADNQRSSENDRRRLESQLQLLEGQIQDNRSQLSEERDNVRRVTLQKELEIRELQNRLDKASEDLAKTREALVGAETSKKHLEQRVEDLTKYTEGNKEKLAVYERHGSTASSGDHGDLTKEQQLEGELAEMSSKLKVAERELEKAKERVMQYESMSRASEEALGQLSNTFDEYRRSTDATIATHELAVKTLEEKLVASQEEVTRLNDALKETQGTLDSERTAWLKDKGELEGTIIELSTSEKSSESDRAIRDAEVQQQRERTKAAEQRYQQEVVAHAEAIKSVAEMKEKLSKLQGTSRGYALASETATAKLDASQRSWNHQKEILEKEIAEHSKRFKDLQSQNKVLLQQFDDFAKQAEKARHSAAAPDAEGGEEGRSPEVNQIVNYLRDQNQYLEVQFDAKQAENARLKAQTEHLNHELDETRLTLSQEREKAIENSASASQHSELVQRIEQLNILRESNATLRAESERHSKRVKQLEGQLKEVSSQLEPAQEQARVAQAELEATKGHVTRLENESKRWQERNTQLLSKYDRIDPAEMQALQDEIAELKKKNAALEEEAARLRTNWRNFKKSHDLFKEENPQLKAKNQVLETAKTELEARIASLEAGSKGTGELEQKVKAQETLIGRLRADGLKSRNELINIKNSLATLEAEKTKWAAEKETLMQASSSGATISDEASRLLFEGEKAALEKARDEALAKVTTLEESVQSVSEELKFNQEAIKKLNDRLGDARKKANEEKEAAVQAALTALKAELQSADQGTNSSEEMVKKHAEELAALKADLETAKTQLQSSQAALQSAKAELEVAKAKANSSAETGTADSEEYKKALEAATENGRQEVAKKLQLKDRMLIARERSLKVCEIRQKYWLEQGIITKEMTEEIVPGLEDLMKGKPLASPATGIRSATIPASARAAAASTSAIAPTGPKAAGTSGPASASANPKATKQLPDKPLGAGVAAILRAPPGKGARGGGAARGGAPKNPAANKPGAAATAAPQVAGQVSILGASGKRPRDGDGTEDPQAKRQKQPVAIKRPPPTGNAAAGSSASGGAAAGGP